MLDSLFDKKLTKKFDTLAKKKANIEKEEDNLCKEFMAETSRETIFFVLDTIKESGHPNSQVISEKLLNKYENEDLTYDDILTLNTLYKTNYRNISNKGD